MKIPIFPFFMGISPLTNLDRAPKLINKLNIVVFINWQTKVKKAFKTISRNSKAKKLSLVLIALFMLLAPLAFTFSAYAQTEVPQDGTGGRSDPGAPLSGDARNTDDTVQFHQPADGMTNTILETVPNNTEDVVFRVESNLAGEIVGRNDVFYGLHKFYEEDIVSNLFHNIGELIGKWITELINGWIADTVKFLTGFLRVFVLNPNIAINGLDGNPHDDISPWVRQGADVMYGIAVDLLLLLFILCIWKYWAEAAWRGGGNLMGSVGRLIFTAGLMLAWPTIYAFEIQITNEMIQTVFFNSSDQVAALDAAMAAAVKAGLVATAGLLTNATAGVAGTAFGGVLGAGPGGLVLGTVGGIVAWVGLIIYLVLGGILIAELIYILVLKAIQTALLTAQYMFAPIFLVFFATPDTENVTAGFVRSFVEVSLWTFVWVGLLKIMTIIILSDYNPWGKILLAVGVLQLMIQVPSFLARAQISPMSDFISAGMVTGGLLKAGQALGSTLQSRGMQLADAIGGRFTTGAARGPKQSTNVSMEGLPNGVANQKLYNDIKKAGDGKLGSGTRPPKKPDGDGGTSKADKDLKGIKDAGDGKLGDGSKPPKKDKDKGKKADEKALKPISEEKKKTEGKKGSTADALRGLSTAAKGTGVVAGVSAGVAALGARAAFKKDEDGRITDSKGVPLTEDQLKANAAELAAQGLVPPPMGTSVEPGDGKDKATKAEEKVSGKVLNTDRDSKDKGDGKGNKDDAALKAGMTAAAAAAAKTETGKDKTGGKGDKTKAETGKGGERQLNVPVDEKTNVKGSGSGKDEDGVSVVPPSTSDLNGVNSEDGKETDGQLTSQDVDGERLQVDRDVEEGDKANQDTLKTNLTPGTKSGDTSGKQVSGKLQSVAAALATGAVLSSLNSKGSGKEKPLNAKPGQLNPDKKLNPGHSDQATSELKDATGPQIVEGKNLDAGSAGGNDQAAKAETVDLAQEAEIDQKQVDTAAAAAAAGLTPALVAAMRSGGKGKGTQAEKQLKGEIVSGKETDPTGQNQGVTPPQFKSDGSANAGSSTSSAEPGLNQQAVAEQGGGDSKDLAANQADGAKIVPPTNTGGGKGADLGKAAIAASAIALAAKSMGRGSKPMSVRTDLKGDIIAKGDVEIDANQAKINAPAMSSSTSGQTTSTTQGDINTENNVEGADNSKDVQNTQVVQGGADGKSAVAGAVGGAVAAAAVSAIVPPAKGRKDASGSKLKGNFQPISKDDSDDVAATTAVSSQIVGKGTGAGAEQNVITVDQETGKVVSTSSQEVKAQAQAGSTTDATNNMNFAPGAKIVPPRRNAAGALNQKGLEAQLEGAEDKGEIPAINAQGQVAGSGTAATQANIDASRLQAQQGQGNKLDPNVELQGDGVGFGHTETVSAKIVPPNARGAGAGQQLEVQGQQDQAATQANLNAQTIAPAAAAATVAAATAAVGSMIGSQRNSDGTTTEWHDTGSGQLEKWTRHQDGSASRYVPPQEDKKGRLISGATETHLADGRVITEYDTGTTTVGAASGNGPRMVAQAVPGRMSGSGGSGGSGGGPGGGGPGGPGGPSEPDDGYNNDEEQSPYLNRYHSTNDNKPLDTYQQAGYRMIPPRSIAGNIRLAQNTTLGPSTRADGKAELIGNGKGMTAHVRTGEGDNEQRIGMQMMSAGYAGLIGNDPGAYDAAREACVTSGLDKPQGMAERYAAGMMSYAGGSWSQTANAKQRFQLGMYAQAVEGSTAYVAGQNGNEYTQYLNDRYGPMTPEQQAMGTYIMTNSASPESAWNWAHIPATEALVRNSIPISGTSRAVAANLSVQKSPPWLVGANVRGCMSYIEQRSASELPADVDPMVKDAWVGREAQLMSPAVVNTCGALALEMNEEAASNVDVVNQVAAQVGAGAKNSDYVAAYKAVANLQTSAASYAPPAASGGGAMRMSGGGGAPTPQVDTQVLSSGGGAVGSSGGYANTQSYNVDMVPDQDPGIAADPNISPGMLNPGNTPMSGPSRTRTTVNINETMGSGNSATPPLRHMRFESPVSRGSGGGQPDIQIGQYRGGASGGNVVEQHVEAEIIGSGPSNYDGFDPAVIQGNVEKMVGQYGSSNEAAKAVYVRMNEADIRPEDMNENVANIAMQVHANGSHMMDAAKVAIEGMGADNVQYEDVLEVQAIMDADPRNNGSNIGKSEIFTSRAIGGMSQQIVARNPQYQGMRMPPTRRLMTAIGEQDDYVPREDYSSGNYPSSVMGFLEGLFKRKYNDKHGIPNDDHSRFA